MRELRQVLCTGCEHRCGQLVPSQPGGLPMVHCLVTKTMVYAPEVGHRCTYLAQVAGCDAAREPARIA
jgi:hypothetical protein